MAFQSTEPIGPSYLTVTNKIFKELVNSDHAAQEYRTHIESRLREESANLERERQRSAELESRIASLQWSRSQLEATVQHAADAVGGLQKELEDLRRKSGSSECRVAALSSLSDTLLKILSNISALQSAPQGEVDIVQISTELHRQQNIIRGLEQSNQRLADSLQCLKTALEVTLIGESYWASESDNESVTMVGTTSESAPLPGPEVNADDEAIECEQTYPTQR
ncbi:hypothetical protein BDV11DRAFT_204318 [Aspergillus similis]